MGVDQGGDGRAADNRCLLDLLGDVDAGYRLSAERAWRWQIAWLNDDEAAQQQVEQHLQQCTHCALALAKHFCGMVNTALAQEGADKALAFAHERLYEVFNVPRVTL